MARRKVEKNEIDEYIRSKNTLDRFFLVPKAVSGAEVKLKVKFENEIFSASKSICKLFNLDYGKTTGNNLTIIKPVNGFGNIHTIFIEYKLLDKFLKIDKTKEYEIYGLVWFHQIKAKSFETSFTDKYYELLPEEYEEEPNFPSYVEKKEGEGQIILTLKEIL